MEYKEMMELKELYGEDLRISKAVHLQDEDWGNEYQISFRGILVGSELVEKDFVMKYIEENFGIKAPTKEEREKKQITLEEKRDAIEERACERDRDMTEREQERYDELDEQIDELRCEYDEVENARDALYEYMD